jgi:hypothetical protein
MVQKLSIINLVVVLLALEKMVPADFEKDDDDNGHIDFISAAAVCIYS